MFHLSSIFVIYLTSFLTFRAQAKRRKTGGSETAPTRQEPEETRPASPAQPTTPGEAREETPADAPQFHKPADVDMAAPEGRSPIILQPPKPPIAEDATLIKAGYQSPTHVLTKHTGEGKESSPEKFDITFPSWEKMSTDDLHADYLNRLNASQNLARKLVGLMKSKFEVPLLSCFPYTLM